MACEIGKIRVVMNKPANADVMMSVNLVIFASFFWYFLVSTAAMPLTFTPARDIAPKGILTGNVLNVATLDIPETTLKLFEQHLAMSVDLKPWGISHVSSHTFLLASPTPFTFLGPRLDGKILGPKA